MPALRQWVAAGHLAIGDGYRAKNDELGGNGPIFLRSAYLQDSGWVLSDPDRLASGRDDFGAKVAVVGDTVLTTKGNSLGRLGFVDSGIAGAVYSPHLSYWRSLNHLVLAPRFLHYWAKSDQCMEQVQAKSHSTDMAPYLSLADQGSIILDVPSIEQQQFASDILSSLDDKIALNRRMAATLEGIARALFQSWFVGFDPVRRAATGRDSGLPVQLATLFPTTFTDDGLPQGWTLGTISSLAEINPVTRLAVAPSVPYVDMAALPTTGSRIARVAQRPAGSGARFTNGDTLIARITPCLENGKTAFVDCLPDGTVGWGSTEFIVLRPHDEVPRALPYLIARYEPFRTHLIAAMSGTSGRQRVQADVVDRWEVAIPPAPVLRAFDELVDPMFERLKALGKENDTLAALHDLLLPRLISGGLRVRDAETIAAGR